jgi:hypothetical protein
LEEIVPRIYAREISAGTIKEVVIDTVDVDSAETGVNGGTLLGPAGDVANVPPISSEKTLPHIAMTDADYDEATALANAAKVAADQALLAKTEVAPTAAASVAAATATSTAALIRLIGDGVSPITHTPIHCKV